MISKWIHLEQTGGDPWVLPIWAAVHEAVEEGRAQPVTPAMGERAIHVSTRLNLLPWIVDRVNSGAHALYLAARNADADHHFTDDHEGATLKVADDVKYPLLADLDSLLFELNAVCESMLLLFEEIHTHAGAVLPRATAGESIQTILEEAGEDTSWFRRLDQHRNFFMHQGAPYAAIDTSNALGDYDLLILKQNVNSFDDPSSFLRLSDVDKILHGFLSSRAVIQEHLRGLFV